MTDRRSGVVASGTGDDLGDLAGLDAAGAHVHPLRRPVDEGAPTLDVRVPAGLGAPVGVRGRHAPGGVLAAHFANCCHWSDPSTRSWWGRSGSAPRGTASIGNM